MMLLREWIGRLAGSLRRGRTDDDLERELRSHLELAAEDARRRGVPSDAAERAARLRAGGAVQALEAQRDQRGFVWMEDLGRDLRYAVRTLARARGFAAAAVVSLALGIGANTAILTLIDAVLFTTMPVDRPDRLYFIGHDPGPQLGLASNYPLLESYRTAPVFSGVTAYRTRSFRVVTAEGVDQAAGQYVSGNYHAVVSTPMALGRGFVSEPDTVAGASPFAVISYDYWQSRFGGAGDVVGRKVTVGGQAVTITGVTERGFHGLTPGARSHITLPFSMMALESPEFFGSRDGWVGMTMVGRLAAGVSEPEALAAVEVVFQRFVQDPANGFTKAPNRDRFRAAALVPAARGTFGLRRQYATPLWLLLAMVALLLTVACANVAILFLARSADRSREIAVRMSIGAGRARLIRQLLTESALLAVLGGSVGIVFAIWATRGILSVFAIGPSPAAIDASVNLPVLAATAVVVLVTGLGFGVVPALRSTRVDLVPTLKAAGHGIQGGGRQVRGRALVIAQISLCVVLVTAAGLLSGSLRNLHRFDAGFDRGRVMLADLNLVEARLPPEERLRVFTDLLDRLQRIPGVESATVSLRTPIDFSSQVRRIEVPGFAPTPRNGVSPNSVTPSYFDTFGLAVTLGRGFTEADRQGAQRVAVISEAMARHFYAGADPLGQAFVLAPSREPTTIVGVVEDARHEGLRAEAPPRMVYLPLSQHPGGLDNRVQVPDEVTVSLRTSVDPAGTAAAIRSEIRAINKDALVRYPRTFEQQIDAALIPERLMSTLSTWFAAIGLLLSCVGVYGVMACDVARRGPEIALRLALGDRPGAILARVLREAAALWTAGAIVGVSAALGVTRMLSSFLFGLRSYDPWTLTGACALLLAVALTAGVLPARRAARIDPAAVLRQQ